MTEFWETAFTKMQMAWGLEPTVFASRRVRESRQRATRSMREERPRRLGALNSIRKASMRRADASLEFTPRSGTDRAFFDAS